MDKSPLSFHKLQIFETPQLKTLIRPKRGEEMTRGEKSWGDGYLQTQFWKGSAQGLFFYEAVLFNRHNMWFTIVFLE